MQGREGRLSCCIDPFLLPRPERRDPGCRSGSTKRRYFSSEGARGQQVCVHVVVNGDLGSETGQEIHDFDQRLERRRSRGSMETSPLRAVARDGGVWSE